MQETRQQILDILGEAGEATVDDLVASLRKKRDDSITAVTVRHHLNELLEQHLINHVELRRRNTPGRPQHVYALTEKAKEFSPTNYRPLIIGLMTELSEKLPGSQINVILEGVANRMSHEAGIADVSMTERLDRVVAYLNQHGYNAHWDTHGEGYILQTTNCPYHHVAKTSEALCEMDFRLVASLIGVLPRLITRKSHGDMSCSYLIPYKTN